MDFSQSALFLDLSFKFVISYLLIPVGTKFYHLFLGRPLVNFPVKHLTYFSRTIHSVNTTNPIQPTYSDKRKYV